MSMSKIKTVQPAFSYNEKKSRRLCAGKIQIQSPRKPHFQAVAEV
ncbi:hypothetical protein ADINL_3095 [Nitrincola lacisaponensis]|uniref:Uncharacterized protein n=1 Tax=Nitrincola lacisaponensis TaxID=267850 RepID=A0A063Y0E1_9GAMM|nr:hypothetical protein ADINL_3095 [Nitrincola lacisaponensis]